mmetsp:Transcript_47001/g.125030  ORF Transcript_47001/g.125030 Transcript_47001/m.125030 type:complete len:93 (-) Transcript_47001:230-508(-)
MTFGAGEPGGLRLNNLSTEWEPWKRHVDDEGDHARSTAKHIPADPGKNRLILLPRASSVRYLQIKISQSNRHSLDLHETALNVIVRHTSQRQ